MKYKTKVSTFRKTKKGYTGYAVNNGKPFYIDEEDYSKVKGVAWYDFGNYIGNRRLHPGIMLKHLITDYQYSFLTHKDGDYTNLHKDNLTTIVRSKKAPDSTPEEDVTGIWKYYQSTAKSKDPVTYYRVFINIDNKWKYLMNIKEDFELALKCKLYAENYFVQRGLLDERSLDEQLIDKYDIEDMEPPLRLLKSIRKIEMERISKKDFIMKL